MATARPLQLLERDAFLTTLGADLAAATAGDGRTAVVSGEAGIGKTSLVEAFAESDGIARVLWGACEALSSGIACAASAPHWRRRSCVLP